jgi:hypothetical protein
MMAEDLAVFFSEDDFAVPASWRGESVSVLFETPDAVLLAGTGVAANAAIVYPAGAFEGLDAGDSISVEELAYRVVERPQAIDDGKLMRALLRTA